MKQRNKTISRGDLGPINNQQLSIASGKSKNYLYTLNRKRPDIVPKIAKLKDLVRQMIEVVRSM